jgi:hypothetical protein
MKTYKIIIVLIISLAFVGCASQSTSMRNQLVKNQHKENLKILNEQKSEITNIDHLAQYAVTANQKTYFNLLNSFLKAPEQLKGKEMNPMTDRTAKSITDYRLNMFKRIVMYDDRINKIPRTNSVKKIKAFQQKSKKPFYMLTVQPEQSHDAIIYYEDLSAYTGMALYENNLYISINYEPKDIHNSSTIMRMLTESFSFLNNDKAWGKQLNSVATNYAKGIKIYEEMIAIYEQEYKENEANSNSTGYAEKKEQLERDISESKNILASLKKKYEASGTGNINNVIYTYKWRSDKRKNAMNMIVIAINNKYEQADVIGVTISKLVYR